MQFKNCPIKEIGLTCYSQPYFLYPDFLLKLRYCQMGWGHNS